MRAPRAQLARIMLPVALTLVVAFALIAVLLRRPGVFAPVMAFAGQPDAAAIPGDDEEEMPETDRAPRHRLAWAVAAVAVLRLTLLVTLHA
jgi:hypothetical protein